MIEPETLKRIVEAALLASGNPLSPAQLLALFGEHEQPGHDDIARALAELQADAGSRGVELVVVASGFRYQVRADVHAWVARLWTERQTKYTRATLETLALIAYRQPITRGEIEQVRGVAVSSNIIKALEEREWIRVIGHRDVPGRPELFGTTKTFLDYFGLRSLDALPPLAELKDIAELDPQLPFDIAPPGVASAALAAEFNDDILSGDSDEADLANDDGDEEDFPQDDPTVETTTGQSTDEAGEHAEPEQK